MNFDKETVEAVLKDYESNLDKLIGPYGEIYRRLKALGIMGIREDQGYRKYSSGGYMDLSVDILEDNEDERRIAMAHNFIQNGDVMADPDMEIKIHKKLEAAEALTYQLDSLGVYQEVYPEPGKINVKLKKDLNKFLLQWLRTLEKQGFYKLEDNKDV